MATGWTWDQIDALKWPAYMQLAKYWETHPPTHLLMRAWLGIGGK